VNFLAHVFLANSDPDSIVGQLCGDFIRGSDLDHFPAAVVRGIKVHRAVDSFTDKHPVNLQARQLFSAPHRRYAGIITDVAYDHYLALDWRNYSDIPLQEYSTLVDQSLSSRFAVLPESLQRFAPYLQSEKILQNNIHRAHIELTLERISLRRKSMAPLATAAPSLWLNNDQLKYHFDRFFPELIEYTKGVQYKLQAETSVQGAIPAGRDND